MIYYNVSSIMQTIGLISDTHGFFDPRLYHHFKDVDQIWHAGDIGAEEVLHAMESFKPTRAVWGNIDDAAMRRACPEVARFICEGVDVLMTHIGGYPGRYAPNVKGELNRNPPRIFICGHSHVLKVVNDPRLGLLHLNPGAVGKHGFHAVRTALRFKLSNGSISNMEVIELVD